MFRLQQASCLNLRVVCASAGRKNKTTQHVHACAAGRICKSEKDSVKQKSQADSLLHAEAPIQRKSSKKYLDFFCLH